MNPSAICAVLLLVQASAPPQQPATLRIEVVSGAAALPGASIAVGDRIAITDAQGVAIVVTPPGRLTVTILLEGYVPVTASVDVGAGAERLVRVEMHAQPEHEETITVSATRTNKRLEDQPMRVEVLDREEIEEKMLMTPGDIVMMLNEMGGMRVQATSPSLGAATVRIQGLRGRYTRVLSDGLPLYGQQVGGLGLLQIPPMDLGQVEVIKGVASALYGAGAMGGVIDLVSRHATSEREHELLINRTTRGGTDTVAWIASPCRPAGARRSSPGDIGRTPRTWMGMRGPTSPRIRGRSFGRGSSGRMTAGAPSSRPPALPGRTEPGARWRASACRS